MNFFTDLPFLKKVIFYVMNLLYTKDLRNNEIINVKKL